MDALWNTQDNLKQLLSNKYVFAKEVDEFNCDLDLQTSELTYKTIQNLYFSPSVKRQVSTLDVIISLSS